MKYEWIVVGYLLGSLSWVLCAELDRWLAKRRRARWRAEAAKEIHELTNTDYDHAHPVNCPHCDTLLNSTGCPNGTYHLGGGLYSCKPPLLNPKETL